IAGMTNSQIPPLSFVAGRGWVQFQADDKTSHVNFSIDKNGETLRLYGTNLTLIDSVDFGLQTTGVSQGRLPDGNSAIVSFPSSASPEASNYLPLPNVVINEVL